MNPQPTLAEPEAVIVEPDSEAGCSSSLDQLNAEQDDSPLGPHRLNRLVGANGVTDEDLQPAPRSPWRDGS